TPPNTLSLHDALPISQRSNKILPHHLKSNARPSVHFIVIGNVVFISPFRNAKQFDKSICCHRAYPALRCCLITSINCFSSTGFRSEEHTSELQSRENL